MPAEASAPLHQDDGNVVLVLSVRAETARWLQAYCDALEDDPSVVIEDAVALFRDQIEPGPSLKELAALALLMGTTTATISEAVSL